MLLRQVASGGGGSSGLRSPVLLPSLLDIPHTAAHSPAEGVTNFVSLHTFPFDEELEINENAVLDQGYDLLVMPMTGEGTEDYDGPRGARRKRGRPTKYTPKPLKSLVNRTSRPSKWPRLAKNSYNLGSAPTAVERPLTRLKDHKKDSQRSSNTDSPRFDELLKEALTAVFNGSSINRAVNIYRIPRQTLKAELDQLGWKRPVKNYVQARFDISNTLSIPGEDYQKKDTHEQQSSIGCKPSDEKPEEKDPNNRNAILAQDDNETPKAIIETPKKQDTVSLENSNGLKCLVKPCHSQRKKYERYPPGLIEKALECVRAGKTLTKAASEYKINAGSLWRKLMETKRQTRESEQDEGVSLRKKSPVLGGQDSVSDTECPEQSHAPDNGHLKVAAYSSKRKNQQIRVKQAADKDFIQGMASTNHNPKYPAKNDRSKYSGDRQCTTGSAEPQHLKDKCWHSINNDNPGELVRRSEEEKGTQSNYSGGLKRLRSRHCTNTVHLVELNRLRNRSSSKQNDSGELKRLRERLPMTNCGSGNFEGLQSRHRADTDDSKALTCAGDRRNTNNKHSTGLKSTVITHREISRGPHDQVISSEVEKCSKSNFSSIGTRHQTYSSLTKQAQKAVEAVDAGVSFGRACRIFRISATKLRRYLSVAHSPLGDISKGGLASLCKDQILTAPPKRGRGRPRKTLRLSPPVSAPTDVLACESRPSAAVECHTSPLNIPQTPSNEEITEKSGQTKNEQAISNTFSSSLEMAPCLQEEHLESYSRRAVGMVDSAHILNSTVELMLENPEIQKPLEPPMLEQPNHCHPKPSNHSDMLSDGIILDHSLLSEAMDCDLELKTANSEIPVSLPTEESECSYAGMPHLNGTNLQFDMDCPPRLESVSQNLYNESVTSKEPPQNLLDVSKGLIDTNPSEQSSILDSSALIPPSTETDPVLDIPPELQPESPF